jgi:hypothetical protein
MPTMRIAPRITLLSVIGLSIATVSCGKREMKDAHRRQFGTRPALAFLHRAPHPGVQHLQYAPDGTLIVAGSCPEAIRMGGTQVSCGGTQHLYIAALDSAGVARWITIGPSYFLGGAFAIDGAGNTIVVGGEHIPTLGTGDAFILKIGSDGKQRWMQRWGGYNASETSVATNAWGEVAAAVWFAGQTPEQPRGGTLRKIDSEGRTIWSRPIPSPPEHNSMQVAVAIDATGEVAVLRTTWRYVPRGGGERKGALVAWSADGTQRWETPVPGEEQSYATVVADSANDGWRVKGSWHRKYGKSGVLRTEERIQGDSRLAGRDPDPDGGFTTYSHFHGSVTIGGAEIHTVDSEALPVANDVRLAGPPGSETDLLLARYTAKKDPVWAFAFGSRGIDSPGPISVSKTGQIAISGRIAQETTIDGKLVGDYFVGAFGP